MSTLIAVPQSSSDNALAVANSSTFLPRVKLCQGSAKEVNTRKVARGGNFALIRSKEEIEDLGDEVIMIPVAGRAKALDTSGEVIITNFDPKSSEFLRIEELSKDKDSGAMYGPEYLVWLPDHNTFALLFLCSPTARREGGAVHAHLGRGALLTSELIDNKKFQWFGPKIKDYSAPIPSIPSQEDIDTQHQRFQNEKSSQVRVADDPAAAEAARDR